MPEPCYFSHSEGSGYMEASKDSVPCHAQPITIGGEVIEPGQSTELQGFFRRPLEYLGLKDENEMIFYIGEDQGIHYFKSIFWISETRFFIAYKPGSGRDFNFVNGAWK